MGEGLPWRLSGKEPPCQCRRHGFSPWRRNWQPTPVFLPGESRGQRGLVGFSPGVCKRVGHDLATKQQLMGETQEDWKLSRIAEAFSSSTMFS